MTSKRAERRQRLDEVVAQPRLHARVIPEPLRRRVQHRLRDVQHPRPASGRRPARARAADRRRCRGPAPPRARGHELQQRALALVAARIPIRARQVALRELLTPPLFCRHEERMDIPADWVTARPCPGLESSSSSSPAVPAGGSNCSRTRARNPRCRSRNRPADRLLAQQLPQLGDRRRLGLAAVQRSVAERSRLQRTPVELHRTSGGLLVLHPREGNEGRWASSRAPRTRSGATPT